MPEFDAVDVLGLLEGRWSPVIAPDDARCTFTWPLPWWMGPEQDDPCRCDLPAGHAGDHSCEHIRAKAQEVTQ